MAESPVKMKFLTGHIPEHNQKNIELENYLNRSIKEITSKNPEVAAILNSYNLGCVPCSGSCRMRHILENQYLSEKQEQEMLCRIEQAIHSDKDIKDQALRKTRNRDT